MAKKLYAFLPLLYGEVAHLLMEGIHEITHGLWEHITIGCIVEKLTHFTGIQEVHMITIAADYFVPIGVVTGIGYIGWRVTKLKTAGENHVRDA